MIRPGKPAIIFRLAPRSPFSFIKLFHEDLNLNVGNQS